MQTNEIWEMIISILLAIFGGMARLLEMKGKATLKLSRMLSELFIAAFIGSMTFLLAKEFHTESQHLMWLLAGTGGWVGPKILNLIFPVLEGLNIDIKETTTKKKK